MSKGKIISAFATCGKTYLGKRYSNVIDLESSNYKFINQDIDVPVEVRKGSVREINSEWPNNYYEAIVEAQSKYDIVLVQLKPEHFDYFDQHNIQYSIAYPNLNNWDNVEKRCRNRNNNEKFINKLKEVFEPYYVDSMKRNYEKFYILSGDMTLETCLIEDGIELKCN